MLRSERAAPGHNNHLDRPDQPLILLRPGGARAMDQLAVFWAFYVVLFVSAAVIMFRGIKGLVWITEGDTVDEKRWYALKLATVPLSVTLFAALILDEMILRGEAPDVEVLSPHYLKTLAFCLSELINSATFDVLESFGRTPRFGLVHAPSFSLSSGLIFSLNLFGGLVAVKLILLALGFHRRMGPS